MEKRTSEKNAYLNFVQLLLKFILLTSLCPELDILHDIA